MNKYLKIMATTAIVTLATGCAGKQDTPQQNQETFKWQIDRFDDIKIMRYQIPDWNTLSLQQKKLAYYLSEAAYWGRDILTDQNFKYNLTIRRTLEDIYGSYNGDKSTEQWKLFEKYLKKVWFANGIHHHYSNDKFIPEFTEEYFRTIASSVKLTQPTGNTDEFLDFICNIMFNPDVAKSKNNSSANDIIAESATNFYEGLTEAEVEKYYASMPVPDVDRPISKGLNSKLIKQNGAIVEQTYKVGGMYDKAITKIVENLSLAKEFAETEQQKQEIEKLIEYYTTGNLTTWDEYNIIWSQDTIPQTDYVNGFIETYDDPLGYKATWEGLVNFKDIEATKKTITIGENAQWFEDNSPIDNRFKKKNVKGITAKAINVVALAGATYPAPPIGINLPNADWIRKEHGSKSVTITNLIYAYDQAALETGGSLEEFAYDEQEIERSKKYSYITSTLHTDLHECLGHGSGQLLPGTDPNALKNHQSTLEEARADLFGLYYIADPKMAELGLLPDTEAYKAEYDGYIRNGLITQLTRILPGKNIEEAHMRNRALISHWVYEKGLNDNVITMTKKDGKTYVKINDYQKLRTLLGELLAEIQRIKSEGDYKAGAKLVEDYAVKVDPVLHAEVLERYNKLNLAPYGGFVNPVLTPKYDKNNVIEDITVSYTEDYIEQMMRLSRDYSVLPSIN